MLGEKQNKRTSSASTHILVSLCLITTCLQNTTLPSARDGGQIFLWFTLAAGYTLAIASVFIHNAEIKALVARLSALSACLSMIWLMWGQSP
jgi:hypothetical protein